MVEELYRSILTIMYKYKYRSHSNDGQQINYIILTTDSTLYGKFSKEFCRY